MKRKNRKALIAAVTLLVLSAVFTILVLTVDVQPIGPQGTKVGLASLNRFIFELLGVNLLWYTITDWLGVVAIAVALVFAVVGIVQWIQRKNIFKVDRGILALGGFYIIVVALYVFFELHVVNYRPILLYENPEASFPSSHTLIVCFIMATAMMQFQELIMNKAVRYIADGLSVCIISVTVIGRLISGVHWFTDIVGGLLICAALVVSYHAMVEWIKGKTAGVQTHS